MRKYEPITRTPVRLPGRDDGNEERHPAFGMIGISHGTNSPGAVLFGSDLKHTHTIRLTIAEGTVARSLNRDWFHPRRRLIEVELSESQFAALITRPNMGEGVPCTIRATETGPRPGIVPEQTRTDVARQETVRATAEARKAVTALLGALGELKMSRADREKIRGLGIQVENALGPNLAYAARTLAEHFEETQERAKTEVEAFIERRIRRAGLEALDAAALRALASGDADGEQQ